MKEIFKNGGKLFLKLILVNVLSLFLVISFTVIFNGMFTKNIGYIATGTTSESEEAVELYRHYFADGEDTNRALYEEQGYTVYETEIRSELSSGENIALHVITEIFCFLILYSFVYPNIWHMGTKDSNLVKFKHKEEDLLKGLKIGLIAVAPMVLFALFLGFAPIKFATAFPLSLYRLGNSSLYSFISVIMADKRTFGELSVLQVLLLGLIQLVPVVIAAIAYLLGTKNISLADKLIYKKNKTEK